MLNLLSSFYDSSMANKKPIEPLGWFRGLVDLMNLNEIKTSKMKTWKNKKKTHILLPKFHALHSRAIPYSAVRRSQYPAVTDYHPTTVDEVRCENIIPRNQPNLPGVLVNLRHLSAYNLLTICVSHATNYVEEREEKNRFSIGITCRSFWCYSGQLSKAET